MSVYVNSPVLQRYHSTVTAIRFQRPARPPHCLDVSWAKSAVRTAPIKRCVWATLCRRGDLHGRAVGVEKDLVVVWCPNYWAGGTGSCDRAQFLG